MCAIIKFSDLSSKRVRRFNKAIENNNNFLSYIGTKDCFLLYILHIIVNAKLDDVIRLNGEYNFLSLDVSCRNDPI